MVEGNLSGPEQITIGTVVLLSAGWFVVGPTALDPDVGDNGNLQYTLSGSGSYRFSVDGSTGVITAATQLSASDGPYSFTVTASDQVLMG